MANHEILRVNMDIGGDGENGLMELLELLQERFRKTGSDMAKTMGDMKTSATAGLSHIVQIFKQVAFGRESKAAYSSLRRTVTGFDELNRLVKKTGSGSSGKSNEQLLTDAAAVLEKVAQVGSAVKENIIVPLKQLPELGLEDGLRNLGDGILNLLGITRHGSGVVQQFAFNWDTLNLKTDFWKDTLAYANGLTGDFNDRMAASGLIVDSTAQAMDKLGISTQGSATGFDGLQGAAARCWEGVRQIWENTGGWFEQQVSGPVDQAFSDMFASIDQASQSSGASAKKSFSDLGGHFSQKFSEAWAEVSAAFGKGGEVSTQVEGGVLSGFKQMVNSLIGGVNTVTAEPFNGINNILNTLQNVKIGALRPFAFLTWRISAPKIPYLAQGAVLPANKPFLAMVGDQRHGTNIEAPLATIVDAMGLAMEDYMQGNMAGHAATVDVLRQLLSAVMGISIGDATIAAACDRHHSKMAVVNGR